MNCAQLFELLTTPDAGYSGGCGISVGLPGLVFYGKISWSCVLTCNEGQVCVTATHTPVGTDTVTSFDESVFLKKED